MSVEQPSIIEAKKEEKPVVEPIEIPVQESEEEHAEALALFERHRDFFEHYAKGKIKIKPAPKGLQTFAFDLETNTIYVNAKMFKKIFGFVEQKIIFLTLHEIEHFLEKIQILAEEGGERKFLRWLQKIKSSEAFSLMDNCVADIREYRSLISKTEGMKEVERLVFKEDLFAETDFTNEPRHIQFNFALLRENRVPGEKCQVAPEVRQALDEVTGVKNLMDIMTNPWTPMSVRFQLQDKYIWPKVEALLQKDIEDKKKQKTEQTKQEKKKGKGKGEPQKGQEKGKKEGGEKTSGGEENDPNKIFADEYVRVKKKFPEAMPIKEIEKAFEKWKEIQKGKNSADRADEDYAKKIGVEKEDLQNYRKIVESLQEIVNPETDVSVVEELKNLFLRIISKRLKKAQAPKYPVEEGDELVDPAQLIADVKAGNLQSKVWEDTEIKERRGDRFGEVEVTLVCDQSNSMTEGKKAEEQRKSAVLMMEVLKEFAELCEAEKLNIDKPLVVRSEIYSFGAGEDKKPMKKMSAELGEAERIKVWKELFQLPGTTTDFNCLEAIGDGLGQETKNKIRLGELKKIVIVFTDGGSDDPLKVQVQLKNLRDNGVVVVGVGITSAGAPVLSTYAPEAQVVEEIQKLPFILSTLLREHLKDL